MHELNETGPALAVAVKWRFYAGLRRVGASGDAQAVWCQQEAEGLAAALPVYVDGAIGKVAQAAYDDDAVLETRLTAEQLRLTPTLWVRDVYWVRAWVEGRLSTEERAQGVTYAVAYHAQRTEAGLLLTLYGESTPSSQAAVNAGYTRTRYPLGQFELHEGERLIDGRFHTEPFVSAEFAMTELVWWWKVLQWAMAELPGRVGLEPVPRHARKRLAPMLPAEAVSPFTVLVLRKVTPREHAEGQQALRAWQHRWHVRGHLRRLADGRLVTVRPYVKGPADKPLLPPRQTVIAVTR